MTTCRGFDLRLYLLAPFDWIFPLKGKKTCKSLHTISIFWVTPRCSTFTPPCGHGKMNSADEQLERDYNFLRRLKLPPGCLQGNPPWHSVEAGAKQCVATLWRHLIGAVLSGGRGRPHTYVYIRPCVKQGLDAFSPWGVLWSAHILRIFLGISKFRSGWWTIISPKPFRKAPKLSIWTLRNERIQILKFKISRLHIFSEFRKFGAIWWTIISSKPFRKAPKFSVESFERFWRIQINKC